MARFARLMALAAACMATALAAPASDAPLTGPRFREALEQELAGRWGDVDLRTIFARIEEARGVSILLDRRIDPTRTTSEEARSESVRAFVERLARSRDAGTAIVGNTLYVGPRRAARVARTLAALRTRDLQETAEMTAQRRRELLQPLDLAWSDLDEPAELIARIASRCQLEIADEQLVPHDLWGRALLPGVTAAEALTLVLVQFDLTFSWNDAGRGIRLRPIEEPVAIERTHAPPKGQKPEAALDRWRSQFPELTGRVVGGRVLVSATVETHEQIEDERSGPKPAKATSPARPLDRKVFSLRIANKPLSALLNELARPENGGWKFEYDSRALADAGASLDSRVTFEVKNASIEQLLRAAFEPLGLAFTLEGRSVRIEPVKK